MVLGVKHTSIQQDGVVRLATLSAAILLFAYSMRMAPRSEESRNVPWSVAIACAATLTSWYSIKAHGEPPLVCMRNRQKPGKLCAFFFCFKNFNTKKHKNNKWKKSEWGLGGVLLNLWYIKLNIIYIVRCVDWGFIILFAMFL